VELLVPSMAALAQHSAFNIKSELKSSATCTAATLQEAGEWAEHPVRGGAHGGVGRATWTLRAWLPSADVAVYLYQSWSYVTES
jgi:hypothetical protein